MCTVIKPKAYDRVHALSARVSHGCPSRHRFQPCAVEFLMQLREIERTSQDRLYTSMRSSPPPEIECSPLTW
jgi:hypothetical protein